MIASGIGIARTVTQPLARLASAAKEHPVRALALTGGGAAGVALLAGCADAGTDPRTAAANVLADYDGDGDGAVNRDTEGSRFDVYSDTECSDIFRDDRNGDGMWTPADCVIEETTTYRDEYRMDRLANEANKGQKDDPATPENEPKITTNDEVSGILRTFDNRGVEKDTGPDGQVQSAEMREFRGAFPEEHVQTEVLDRSTNYRW